MKYSEQIKSISYLKAHASEIADDACENGKTYIITQNGEAKLAVLDIKEYQRIQEKLALQKLIALSEKDVSDGNVIPMKEAFEELDVKIAHLKKQWNTK
jgi:prevent-host-death family protein